MWWKKIKVYSKQILKDANLDPVPFVKERVRMELARTVLEPLPVTQTDQGNQVEFQVDAIVLSIPVWQTIKSELEALSVIVSPTQRDTITRLINSIENE